MRDDYEMLLLLTAYLHDDLHCTTHDVVACAIAIHARHFDVGLTSCYGDCILQRLE